MYGLKPKTFAYWSGTEISVHKTNTYTVSTQQSTHLRDLLQYRVLLSQFSPEAVKTQILFKCLNAVTLQLLLITSFQLPLRVVR